MVNAAEIQEKKRRLRGLMEKLELGALYLKRQSNFSWLTAGGLNVVSIAMELGVAGLLLGPQGEYVVCSNIEAPRMEREEKLEDQGYRIHSFPWYRDREVELVRELSGAGTLGADHAFPRAREVSKEVDRLRYSLTPWEVKRYRELGRLTSAAVEEAAREIRPGEKECAVIGRLAERLWANRVDFITTFCAADERISGYRHPIATEKKIERRAMLCVNGRRQGLIVSLTRFVQFGRVPADIRKKYDASVLIDCTMMAHTIPGRPAREAFMKGIEAYRETGFAEEYELHHQGGSIGYAGRDYKVNFDTQEVIQENQGFSWNPSITGTKSEDTMLAVSSGPWLLTMPVSFPEMKIEVGGYVLSRPEILEL